MTELRRCSLGELREHARGRLGLLIGPASTTSINTFWSDLTQMLVRQFGVGVQSTFHQTAESAVERGSDIALVRKAVTEFANAQIGSPILTTFAKLRWTAVISGSPEDQFEAKLVQASQTRPARRKVAVLSDLREAVPSNSTPVYKLLGSAQHNNVVTVTADFHRRMTGLGIVVRDFLDQVKASPVICTGFDGANWLLDPILAQLYSDPSRHPGALFFLVQDPVAQAPRLSQFVPHKTTYLAEGTLMEVARALEPQTAKQQTTFDFARAKGGTDTVDFPEYPDLICMVNCHLTADIKAEERERLLDYLFMPELLNWNPVAHDLDFPRTVLGEIQQDVIEFLNDDNRNGLFVLSGGAASGKTTTLKRLAFNLASEGVPVCWLRDYWYHDFAAQFTSALKDLHGVLGAEPLVIFIDTIALLHDMSISVIASAAERLRFRVVFVLGCRSSDVAAIPQYDDSLPVRYREMAPSLDENEWQILPDYLTKLGMYDSPEAARAAIQSTHGRSARDYLALLYYLLPKTKQVITGAIQSEYLSLKNIRKAIEGATTASRKEIQQAYGMVAAASRLGVPVPIEVLVNAVRGNFVDWAETLGSKGPAWGLLYPDDTEDVEGARYRTRNAVVTEIVLALINGSHESRAGEVRLLKELLLACDSSNPIYQRFCERILVPNSKLADYSLTEGIELYDAAIRALPYKSKPILHHKGIFVRKKGGDLDVAMSALDEALQASPSPHDERTELDEFIHTSKAAVVVEKLDRGELSWADGHKAALRELERSRTPRFINANAVHVYAGLVEQLAFRKEVPPEVDQYDLVNRALCDIDKTLIVTRGSTQRSGRQANVALLESRRDDLLARLGDSDIGAERVWENHRSQQGFVVAVRRRLAVAMRKDEAGTEFKAAFEYWNEVTGRVRESASVAPELAEVGAVLYYTWRVEPRSQTFKRNVNSPIEWDLLRSCAETTLQGPRFSKDPFYRFLYGLSLAQLNDWPSANAVFQQNRNLGVANDVLHAYRAYFLHPDGKPWQLQGKVNAGATSNYFRPSNIPHDFEVVRNSAAPARGGLQWAYLVFSFAGPRATQSDQACKRD